MLSIFAKKPAALTFRVRAKDDTITNVDGENTPIAKGAEIDLPNNEAAALIDCGRFELVGRVIDGELVRPKGVQQLPCEEFTEEPFPEEWADLPAEFKTAWPLIQQHERLEFEVRQARKVSERGHSGIAVGQAAITQLENRKAAVREAEENLQRFNRAPLERAWVRAGQAVMSEVQSVNALAEEIRKTAFAIFEARTSALGLSQIHTRALFGGSELSTRYRTEKITLHDQCRAGGVLYVDAAWNVLAQMIMMARARRVDWTRMLLTAKAELHAAESGARAEKKEKIRVA